MIIYGYKTTPLKTEPIPYEKCPDCGHEGAMAMHMFSSYTHVYWIPLFPYKKFGIAHCGRCNAQYKKQQMNDGLKRELTNIKSMAKPPVWTFAGLILAGLFFLFTFLGN